MFHVYIVFLLLYTPVHVYMYTCIGVFFLFYLALQQGRMALADCCEVKL